MFHFLAKKLPKTDPTQQRGGTQGRGRVVDIQDPNPGSGGGCCSKS